MMNCKQATEMMSQAQDQKLSFKEHTALRVHLLLCKGCKNCNRQLDFIRKAMHHISQR